MPKERIVTLAGEAMALRYDLHERDYAEKQLGKGLFEAMQGGTVEGTVAILWAGVHRAKCQRKWERRTHTRCDFTLDDMFELLEAHREGGGDYDDAVRQATWAMFESGTFGKAMDLKTLTRILGEDEAGKAPAPVVAQ